jgi:hypothetical protein
MYSDAVGTEERPANGLVIMIFSRMGTEMASSLPVEQGGTQ